MDMSKLAMALKSYQNKSGGKLDSSKGFENLLSAVFKKFKGQKQNPFEKTNFSSGTKPMEFVAPSQPSNLKMNSILNPIEDEEEKKKKFNLLA